MSKIFYQKLYSWGLLPLLWGVLHLLSLKNKKLQASLKGRQDLWSRVDEQSLQRSIHQPLVWFHVASVGEFLQAKPLIECFDKEGYQMAITVTSVSGYEWIQKDSFIKTSSVVLVEYLPFDFQIFQERLLSILQPQFLIYTRSDLWPNLLWAAFRRKIPQFLISAALPKKSFRYHFAIARQFYQGVHSCLDGIFAVSSEDAQRFQEINPEHGGIKVIGETRFDGVLSRKKTSSVKLPRFSKDDLILVVGSCWTPDEECIFSGIQCALQQFSQFKVILVPHEPTESHLQQSEMLFKLWAPQRLSQVSLDDEIQSRILLVDSLGMLSSLYSIGHLSFVGGGFTSGVHNVLEPGVMGLPIFFGPKYHNAPEAIELVKQNLAMVFSDSMSFEKQLLEWIEYPEKRVDFGHRIHHFIESHQGATERCFQQILKY